MSNWIAYSIVTAIAAAILLSVSSVRTQVDELVVATVRVRSAKKLALESAAVIERDMRNVGSNFPTYDLPPDSAVVDWETDSTLNFFEFVGQASPNDPPAVIRYEWVVVGSTSVEGDTKPVYKLSRFVDGVVTGYSASVFTGISIEPLRDDGAPADVGEEVRQIAVELLVLGTVGNSSVLGETRWNAVYRPQAIAREDNEDV